MRELWLIRHGETEWSRSGAHTGVSDIPLTAAGRDEATALGRYLEPRQFALVLVSPLERARETCRLAGYPDAQIDADLREWDYGDYEGLTLATSCSASPGEITRVRLCRTSCPLNTAAFGEGRKISITRNFSPALANHTTSSSSSLSAFCKRSEERRVGKECRS